jgi:hypothetical protein
LKCLWGRLSGRSAGWFVIFYETPHASVMEKNGSDIFNFLNGLCDGILGTSGGVKDLMLLGAPR